MTSPAAGFRNMQCHRIRVVMQHHVEKIDPKSLAESQQAHIDAMSGGLGARVGTPFAAERGFRDNACGLVEAATLFAIEGLQCHPRILAPNHAATRRQALAPPHNIAVAVEVVELRERRSCTDVAERKWGRGRDILGAAPIASSFW
eukprot:CAMPEP_0194754220 /NCGR_PEP_ID=MMETSP0323_2-20130528/8186_1 /TAXON_ID=2866 ORGANISM="Crypthecodinium cohnii, Strain Seligo" /NCGR_SAMPLE_ID=MMETSP0323_2 /ASSEMBLY_ACC=CAM_ASM_000346 /LENGTH=145 /DNA_ID=CAMNT_0039672601 /DNA_START=153 /DNA_END=591 /DNA_ORIENTATION=-